MRLFNDDDYNDDDDIFKMFSDCHDDCIRCITHYTGGCLAGHGDDDFTMVNEKQAKEMLDSGKNYRGNLLHEEERKELEKIAGR
jgi:hypothetical protein